MVMAGVQACTRDRKWPERDRSMVWVWAVMGARDWNWNEIVLRSTGRIFWTAWCLAAERWIVGGRQSEVLVIVMLPTKLTVARQV
jgi:hypothetical protein